MSMPHAFLFEDTMCGYVWEMYLILTEKLIDVFAVTLTPFGSLLSTKVELLVQVMMILLLLISSSTLIFYF